MDWYSPSSQSLPCLWDVLKNLFYILAYSYSLHYHEMVFTKTVCRLQLKLKHKEEKCLFVMYYDTKGAAFIRYKQ